jgi:Asp/Glu/hydantoin racemase
MTSTTSGPLVALIGATPAAIPPARTAFATHFPDAELWNILDDGLLERANQAGGLTPHLRDRMRRLIDHAVLEGAAGILLTCSMYSSVAQLVAADLDVPILGPDDAAFTVAANGAYRSVLVVASLPAALVDTQARLVAAAEQRGTALEVRGVVAEGAFGAVQAGDRDALLASLVTATTTADGPADVDAVLLAQYSLTPVAEQLQQHIDRPILSGPTLAAQTLRASIGDGARAARGGRS